MDDAMDKRLLDAVENPPNSYCADELQYAYYLIGKLNEYIDDLKGAVHNLRVATTPEFEDMLEAARENALEILGNDPREIKSGE